MAGLLDLPTEILDLLLYHAIQVRGIKRGMRLRLVSKIFAGAAIQALYTYRMLDTLYRGSEWKNRLPNLKLLREYLEYRVINEPADGNQRLTSIRRAALETCDQQALHGHSFMSFTDCVHRLCSVLIDFDNGSSGLNPGRRVEHQFSVVNFREIFKPHTTETRVNFQSILLSAALCTDNYLMLRSLGMPDREQLYNAGVGEGTLPFPSPADLAGMYSQEKSLAYLMIAPTGELDRTMRALLLISAAKASRLATVQFVYNFQRTQTPWDFSSSPHGHMSDSEALDRSLDTLDLEVFNFIMDICKTHSISIHDKTLKDDTLSKLCATLRRNARAGKPDMVQAILSLRDRNGSTEWINPRRMTEALIAACRCGAGNIAVIDLLIEHGADTSFAMSAAANCGRTALVRDLLARGVVVGHAMLGAAKGPYFDIMQLLLDAGADANGVTGSPTSLEKAVRMEHTELFRTLVRRGAEVRVPAAEKGCVLVARREGLESMLEMLGEYCVDTKSVEGRGKLERLECLRPGA